MCLLFGKAHKVAKCVRELQDYLSENSFNYFNFEMRVNTKSDWEFSDIKKAGSLRLLYNVSPFNTMKSKYLLYKGAGDVVEELRKLTDEFC